AIQLHEQALAQGQSFGLWLVDWQMRELDGLATARALQLQAERAGRPPAPAVLVTSHDDAGLRQRAAQQGLAAVLAKPVTPSALHDTLLPLLMRSPATVLPVEAGTMVRPAAPAALPLQGFHVLLAEDNPVNQEVALDLLQGMGLTVDLADDGRQAVQRATERAYDLVLMDMQMPDIDGLQATRQIRALDAYRHTPILAMTANAFADDRQRCLDAGMNDHVTKPVDPRALQAKLQQWLSGRASPPAANQR
ncbi:MAG: histidine kinase, partial [Burkholderiales bacterium PBB5]